MFSLLYVCVLLSLLVTAGLNYNPQKQSQTEIISKLLYWQENGCTLVACDHEIKRGNPVPGRVLQEAQGKDSAMERSQHIGLNSWAQEHRPRDIPTEPSL